MLISHAASQVDSAQTSISAWLMSVLPLLLSFRGMVLQLHLRENSFYLFVFAVKLHLVLMAGNVIARALLLAGC